MTAIIATEKEYDTRHTGAAGGSLTWPHSHHVDRENKPGAATPHHIGARESARMTQVMQAWRLTAPDSPLALAELPLPEPGPGEVLLQVIACGLCHTDVGFVYGGVHPKAPLPLTLGHEIVGKVVDCGPGTEDLENATVLVPAVLPCGECELCLSGRGNACRWQKMPGNDFDGGFASHFLAPARFLCPVGDREPHDVEALAVVADAVSTAYQSVERARVGEGDLAIVVGCGGVGTFAVQIARARGAHIIGIDTDARRLAALERYVDLPLNAAQSDIRELRAAVAAFEEEADARRRKILECSGSAAGQESAWALLERAATLMVVGFTRDKVSLRLANLMAFDAAAIGNWGCAPEHYPTILSMADDGDIELEPFVERHPMSSLNDLLRGHPARRPILIPDFEET
jgi:6-hydroxycyclohex-1-ene-1-carbonyl-CoA dehydrogenase